MKKPTFSDTQTLSILNRHEAGIPVYGFGSWTGCQHNADLSVAC